MDLSTLPAEEKVSTCRKYYIGGFFCLPFLWVVNAVWFFDVSNSEAGMLSLSRLKNILRPMWTNFSKIFRFSFQLLHETAPNLLMAQISGSVQTSSVRGAEANPNLCDPIGYWSCDMDCGYLGVEHHFPNEACVMGRFRRFPLGRYSSWNSLRFQILTISLPLQLFHWPNRVYLCIISEELQSSFWHDFLPIISSVL